MYEMLLVITHWGVGAVLKIFNILSGVHLLYLRLQAMLTSGTILEIGKQFKCHLVGK